MDLNPTTSSTFLSRPLMAFPDDDEFVWILVGQKEEGSPIGVLPVDTEPEVEEEDRTIHESDDSHGSATVVEPDTPADTRSYAEYKYNARVLASLSGFVDACLASPMRSGEIESGDRKGPCISFPDVTPAVWEKMIGLYNVTNQLDENLFTPFVLLEILPKYDEYQFYDALVLCDELVKRWAKQATYLRSEMVELFQLAYNLHLPKCRDYIVTTFSEHLEHLMVYSEYEVRSFLPIVQEHKPESVRLLAKIVHGRHANGMNDKELDALVQEPDFPGRLLLAKKQGDDASEMLDRLSFKNLSIRFHQKDDGNLPVMEGTELFARQLCGKYEPVHARMYSHRNGALRNVFQRTYNHHEGVIFGHRFPICIECLDPFGSTWEVAAYPSPQQSESEGEDSGADHRCLLDIEDLTEEQKEARRQVWYRWDCGYSSIVPPRHGWTTIVQDEAIIGGRSLSIDIVLDYFLDHHR